MSRSLFSRLRSHSRLPKPDERIELALDAGAIAGTWFWDVLNDRFTSDRRFARFFSLDEGRLKRGVNLSEVVEALHPEDKAHVRRLIDEALLHGGAFRAEYRVRQRQGGYRWVQANGEALLDRKGRASTFPGVLVDIDARRTAEKLQSAWFRLNDRLRTLDFIDEIVEAACEACGSTIDSLRAGYGVVDPIEETVEIRSHWQRTGTATIVGNYRFREFGSFVDDLRLGRVVAIDDVRTDSRTAVHVDALAAVDIRALLSVPLMRDGQFLGLLLVHDDVPRQWSEDEVRFVSNIADRTWAAIAAADANSQLRALNANLDREVAIRTSDRTLIWNMSLDLLLISTLDGVLTAVNPAWTKLLGWDEVELVGSNLFDLLHPEDVAHTKEGASAVGRDKSLVNFENRYRHKDGTYRWISWSASQGNGMIIAAGRDVSMSKELAEAQEQLRQGQKMEAVGQLTGGVAHDFNNLLTVISTSVTLLKSAKASPEQRSRSLDAIGRTVKRAARLTAQLLAFARRQALKPVVFDAAANVSAVVEMLDTLVGARITVNMQLEPGCFIHADPSQFDTALVNLVVNARDAMEGAGELTIDVRQLEQLPLLRLQPAVPGSYVAVTVRDSGSGIAEADMDRIFEPFFTTKAVGQGTGLGLSQVFGFAKQSGGDVTVESQLGDGAAFTLYFPLSADASVHASDVKDQAEHQARGANARVLVVEDNEEVAAAVEASLQELGYRSEVVFSAKQALRRLESDPGRFDVVFSDVVMTNMDGIEFARQVRRRWPMLPVLLSSGYSHVLARDAAIEFDLLPKPYEVDALHRALRAALSKSMPAQRQPLGDLTPSDWKALVDGSEREFARQAALDGLQILDTPPERSFDDLVRLAANICETPIALVSLVDQDRQWFKARVGIDAHQTPREHAFCAHAIQTPDRMMVVEDASTDARFSTNPLVTGEPGIRFYAGAPLVDSAGHALGTLCVISPHKHTLAPHQADLLQCLAAQVVKRLENRRSALGDTDEHPFLPTS